MPAQPRRGARERLAERIEYHRSLEGDEARESAYRTLIAMLARCDRSRAAARAKLIERGFSEDAADYAVATAQAQRFIDDERLAGELVRIGRDERGMTGRALADYLRRAMIPAALIAQLVGDRDPEDERARARVLASQRMTSLPAVGREAAIRRLCGFLQRRGYSAGLSYAVAREVVDAADEERGDEYRHAQEYSTW